MTFNVDANLTSTEDPPCVTASATVTDQIIFQKSGAGANPVVRPTGAGGTADFGLCISGGDFITFDGIDVSIATGSAVEYGYLVRNLSATNGAKNNTIKNTSITLNRANTNSIGILQSAAATGGGIAATNLTGSNSTNKYYNLTIQNVYAGIYLLGTAAFPDDASEVGVTGVVTKNTIGGASAGDIGTTSSTNAIWGIRAGSQSNAKIFNNEIRNATSASTGTLAGIHIDNAGTVTAVSLGTTQVYNNQIHDLNATSTTAGVVYGIRANLTGNAGSVARIQNNFISAINSSSTSTSSIRLVGINVQDAGTGTGATFNVDNNSIGIAQTNLATINTCFTIGGAGASNPVYDVRNNIFANFTGAQAGAAKHYTWVSTSNTSIM